MLMKENKRMNGGKFLQVLLIVCIPLALDFSTE